MTDFVQVDTGRRLFWELWKGHYRLWKIISVNAFLFAALFLSGRSDWGKKKKKIKDIARLFIGQKSKTGLWECDRKYANVVLSCSFS